jgi:hypothetical protein
MQGTLTLDMDRAVVECPGSWVYEQATWEVHSLRLYDRDGNWIRTQVHYAIEGIWYNHEDPGFWWE